MSIDRVFLDWGRSALHRVADYLAQDHRQAGQFDLGGVIVAVPGGRAGRRFLEVLVEWAERKRCALVPPRIVTVGRLPEMLYQARKPFASHLVQQLAWVQAVRGCDSAVCRQFLPSLPDGSNLADSLALGDMLARLHRELAADALDFHAVADCGVRLPGFREQARWQALAEIQRQYLQALDLLDLWDLQTARLFAIRHGECRTDARIVLVGLADLNQSQRLMLDQVADRVTALILAPRSLADRFDEHGCLRPEAWQDEVLPIPAEKIEIVGDPADQAAAAVRVLAGWDGRYSARDIVIGVPDDRVVPYLQQQFDECRIRARYGVGLPIARCSPYRLLAVAADYLESPRFSATAAMVRHPAVGDWLSSQGLAGDWLSPLDQFFSEHLPYAIDDAKPAADKSPTANSPRPLAGEGQGVRTGGRDTAWNPSDAMASLHRAVEQAVAAFRGEPRALGEWGQPLVDLMLQMFGRGTLNPTVEPDRTVLAACQEIHKLLQEQAAVPTALMPCVTGAEAIRLVLRQVESATIPPLPDHGAIELLGWLELPLDDAPALILTGMNEGIVPSSLNADLFLPNHVRRALGIEDNDRRWARDVYALAMLAASRESLKLIAGRRTGDGDPLVPSRLLLCCDDQELAGRVQRFFRGESASGSAGSSGTLQPGKEKALWEPPHPRPLGRRITSMRVTEFKDYLGCPYRYYLRHMLKLTALDDAAEELDGAAFGSLGHLVLDAFGRSSAAASTNPAEIEAVLSAALERSVKTAFPAALASVLVQVEQLRARLRAFARWQAEWAGQGWRIEHVERQIEEGEAPLVVDGEPMYLRGRIDRIDVHQPSGTRVVLDYKFSDTPTAPDKAHRDKDQWIDLQLPLYRHLVAALDIREPVRLGYVVLPKDTSKVGAMLAEWTDGELAAADRAAETVIRQVRAERFWPPASPPPPFSEDFAAICQDGLFGVAPASEGEEEEES